MCLCLQFGHFCCIQTYSHTGSPGGVAHLLQHPSPLLGVFFIPVKDTEGTVFFFYSTDMTLHMSGQLENVGIWSFFCSLVWALTARCRWLRWANTPCSRSPSWQSLRPSTAALRSWPGSLSFSPGGSLGRGPTWREGKVKDQRKLSYVPDAVEYCPYSPGVVTWTYLLVPKS